MITIYNCFMINAHNNKIRKCFKCKNYCAYYFRKDIKFIKTRFGFCEKKECVVNNTDGCEEYAFKSKRKSTLTAPCYYLEYLLGEISALRQIVEENRNENEDL